MDDAKEEEVQVVVKDTSDPGYVFLDHSMCSFTHLLNPEFLGGESYSDSVDDVFSDDDDDDKGCVDVDVDDFLYDENVKKKLQVLADMVGIAYTASPGVVLAEVVRVLKGLEKDRRDGNEISHNKVLL